MRNLLRRLIWRLIRDDVTRVIEAYDDALLDRVRRINERLRMR